MNELSAAGVVTPGQCRVPTNRDIAAAKRIARRLKARIRGRRRFIERRGVDPAFALSDANWDLDAPNDFNRASRLVAGGNRRTVSLLRMFSQVFSGFNVRTFRREVGESSTVTPPRDLDAAVTAAVRADTERSVERWRRATADIPPRWRVSPPKMLGEVGWDVDGVVVNHDTIVYQERITLMARSGILPRLEALPEPPRILEIGGGYGALTLALKRLFPAARCAIVDLPESLVFSGMYLRLVDPKADLRIWPSRREADYLLVPNHAATLLEGRWDLVINTLSFSEMSERQVRVYVELIRDRWLKPDGEFFEQNQDNSHLGLLCAQNIVGDMMPGRRYLGRFSQGHANVWSLAAPVA